MRRTWIIVLASIGAVLVAGLLLVRSWLLGDDTEPIAVERIVERYRGETAPATAGTLPEGVEIPAAGVYEYETAGDERADLLGGSEHEYPDRTTIAVRAVDCGFEQTWTALDKRSETWTLCAKPGALEPIRFNDVHSFYGRTDDRTYECSGGEIPLRPGGGRSTIVCRREGVTRTDTVRALGAETVDVGGEQVPAVHVRVRFRMAGSTEGGGTYDVWLARATGLPVRVVADNASRSDTPIGAKVNYTERFELRLVSLEPQR
ncbi:MAG: hypothetical protein IRZ32_14780 [Solirubrobacteraceae bacterium]|nr:hypothetical protein [Solirubrobacteraceae bacterium]